MNKLLQLFILLSLALLVPIAHASAPMYEYYSVNSNPSVQASQITGIVGTTMYFADGTVTSVTDWFWWVTNQPSVGKYLVLQFTPDEELIGMGTMSAQSFESEFSPETEAHGGHEPVIIIMD